MAAHLQLARGRAKVAAAVRAGRFAGLLTVRVYSGFRRALWLCYYHTRVAYEYAGERYDRSAEETEVRIKYWFAFKGTGVYCWFKHPDRRRELPNCDAAPTKSVALLFPGTRSFFFYFLSCRCWVNTF